MKGQACAAAGALLIGALAVPPLGPMLEAHMVTHMLVQLPLLVFAGWLLAKPLRAHLNDWLERVDPDGIAAALIAVLASSYWMLPRALDAALADPYMEAAKILGVPLMVGVPAALCWSRLSSLTAGFFIANVLSMWAAGGWLYRVFPARLCNYYLLEEQRVTGEVLLWVSAVLAGLWLTSFFVGASFVPRARLAAGRI
jgi:hypothetical protein